MINILYFILGAVVWSALHHINLLVFESQHPELFEDDDTDK